MSDDSQPTNLGGTADYNPPAYDEHIETPYQHQQQPTTSSNYSPISPYTNNSQQQQHHQHPPGPITPQTYPPHHNNVNPNPQHPHPPGPQPPQPQPQYAPYTYLPLVSTRPGDETIFPQTAQLYNALSREFGSHNIFPPPDWLRTEKARIQWLKRDQNALLYNFHKQDKYKAKMQKMLDSNCACSCCTTIHAGEWDEYSSCSVVCTETLTCCSLFYCTGNTVQQLMYPNSTKHTSCLCCLPFLPCCNGFQLRRKFLKRIQKAGLKYDESCCGTFFKTLLCQCCIATQMLNILQFAYRKRYGLELMYNLDKENFFIQNASPDWVRYYQDMRISPYHPYHRVNTTIYTKEKSNKHNDPNYYEKQHRDHHHNHHHGHKWGSSGPNTGGISSTGPEDDKDKNQFSISVNTSASTSSSLTSTTNKKSSEENEKSNLLQHGHGPSSHHHGGSSHHHHHHDDHKKKDKYVDVARTVINRRELLDQPHVPPTKALLEYYNRPKCIQLHNQRWLGIHQISGLSME